MRLIHGGSETLYIWVNIGSGNNLLLDNNPLPGPVLANHQRCAVAFIWGQCHRKKWGYQLLIRVWKLLVLYYSLYPREQSVKWQGQLQGQPTSCNEHPQVSHSDNWYLVKFDYKYPKVCKGNYFMLIHWFKNTHIYDKMPLISANPFKV